MTVDGAARPSFAYGVQSPSVHLERVGPDVGEHDRDVPERDGPRDGRDVWVLAQRDEQRPREEVDGEQDDGAGEEDDPGPLQVDTQHVVLLHTVGLPAQCLQCARHPQLRCGSSQRGHTTQSTPVEIVHLGYVGKVSV